MPTFDLPTMLRITLAGADVVLHSSGAALLAADHTLLIADAHFGKAVSFRKLARLLGVAGGMLPVAAIAHQVQALASLSGRRLLAVDEVHAALGDPPAARGSARQAAHGCAGRRSDPPQGRRCPAR